VLTPCRQSAATAVKRKEPEEPTVAPAEVKEAKLDETPQAASVTLSADDALFVAQWLNVMGGPMHNGPERGEHARRVCRLRRTLKQVPGACTCHECSNV
jgi:hypothetical protein